MTDPTNEAMSSLTALATLVSETLEAAGIIATLSGGGAVSLFTDNRYLSADLDFVTSAGRRELQAALAPLGFTETMNPRLFEHEASPWLLDFPAAPLGFGDLIIAHEEVPTLMTPHGTLRVITPTLSLIDRLAAHWYHSDPQCWDQAALLAQRADIDWAQVERWLRMEGQDVAELDRLKRRAEAIG